MIAQSSSGIPTIAIADAVRHMEGTGAARHRRIAASRRCISALDFAYRSASARTPSIARPAFRGSLAFSLAGSARPTKAGGAPISCSSTGSAQRGWLARERAGRLEGEGGPVALCALVESTAALRNDGVVA